MTVSPIQKDLPVGYAQYTHGIYSIQAVLYRIMYMTQSKSRYLVESRQPPGITSVGSIMNIVSCMRALFIMIMMHDNVTCFVSRRYHHRLAESAVLHAGTQGRRSKLGYDGTASNKSSSGIRGPCIGIDLGTTYR